MSHREFAGYRAPGYARSFTGVGRPLPLEQAGGWIIERTIPGTAQRDAMGPYPLFSCADWSALPDELAGLRRHGLSSLLLIAEPRWQPPDDTWLKPFDVARPFAAHYVARLDRSPAQIISRHHAYEVRRAARRLEAEVVDRPLDHLDDWVRLYEKLIERHAIRDLRRFSRAAFTELLAQPGVLLLRALSGGRTVGALILMLQDNIAYAHLTAFDDEGYRNGASYLLDWLALEHLSGRSEKIYWGGGQPGDDGLASYKRGWSTHCETSWLLGAVLDRDAYLALCRQAGSSSDCAYFPAYRQGEYGPRPAETMAVAPT